MQYESINDVVTPGYRKIVAEGGIVNNPCEMVFYSLHDGGGNGFWHRHETSSNLDWWHSGNITEFFTDFCKFHIPPLEYNLQSMIEDSRTLALSNIDNTPFAFGEDLGELKETIEFIKTPLKSIQHLFRKIKRLALKRAKRDRLPVVKAFANVYLEYRFALMPLLRSILQAIEAYQYTQPTLPERLTARGFAEVALDNLNATTTSEPIPGWFYSFDHSSSVEVKVSSSILYTVSNPMYDSIRYKLGLRIKDIPHTMWQLLPLSFMVDRLIDISSFIRAATNLADPAVKILAASTVVRVGSYKDWTFSDFKANGFTGTTAGNTCTENKFEFTRTVWQPTAFDLIPPVHPGRLVDEVSSIVDLIALIIALGFKPTNNNRRTYVPKR
jgi:hypothetical protein